MTVGLPNRSLPNTPGPAFFPWLIAGGLILLSAALLARSLLENDDESPSGSSGRLISERLLTLVWFAAYLALLPFAGFLVTSVPFFAGLMWQYGERNRLVLMLATLIVPVGLLFVFRYGFQVLLPAGVW